MELGRGASGERRKMYRLCFSAMLSIGLAGLCASASAATADTPVPTVRIDPTTGAVIGLPAAPSPHGSAGDSASGGAHEGHAKTPASGAHIVRCPDGSLRIGQRARQPDGSPAPARNLCDKPVP